MIYLHAYTNIEFREGNILQIEYPDEKFDVVVAVNVLHLLDEPYKEFIKEAGYENVEYFLIEGKIPCAIAVITK